MGYRELSRMEIIEVIRRWQAGESQRGIARATGLARETVSKCVAAAGTLGLLPNGPPPTDDQVVALVRVGSVVGAPRTWAAPSRDALEPHAERIRRWLQHDELQLTRVQELLAQGGVRCSYMTLLRFVALGGVANRGAPCGLPKAHRAKWSEQPGRAFRRTRSGGLRTRRTRLVVAHKQVHAATATVGDTAQAKARHVSQ